MHWIRYLLLLSFEYIIIDDHLLSFLFDIHTICIDLFRISSPNVIFLNFILRPVPFSVFPSCSFQTHYIPHLHSYSRSRSFIHSSLVCTHPPLKSTTYNNYIHFTVHSLAHSFFHQFDLHSWVLALFHSLSLYLSLSITTAIHIILKWIKLITTAI